MNLRGFNSSPHTFLHAISYLYLSGKLWRMKEIGVYVSVMKKTFSVVSLVNGSHAYAIWAAFVNQGFPCLYQVSAVLLYESWVFSCCEKCMFLDDKSTFKYTLKGGGQLISQAILHTNLVTLCFYPLNF